MSRLSTSLTRSIVLVLVLGTAAATASDWPTYQHDATRGGVTDESLSLPLEADWVIDPPSAIRRAWTEPENRNVEGKDLYDRLGFDDAFQVAAVGDAVYYGSSVDHKLYSLDASDGSVRWSYFTGAPIRLAPTVADGRVYVGSDDGYAYCLDAGNGKLIWKYRAGPTEEWFLGRGEMISRWPVRTGVLVLDGVAYFGAGIFPHENVYMCAVDAASGDVLWRNDNISHQEAGREDLSPQGYLLASEDRLYVPSGRSLPKSFDRKTGELLGTVMTQLAISSGTIAGTNAIMINDRLHLYSPGSQIAGTGSASYVTTGSYLARMDSDSYGEVNSQIKKLRDAQCNLFRQHASKAIDDTTYEAESKRLTEQLQALDTKSVAWRVPCRANSALIVAGRHVVVGGQDEVVVYDAESGQQLSRAQLEGDARGLAVAHGRLLVSTSQGRIYAFGAADGLAATSLDPLANPYEADEWTEPYRAAAAEILKRTGVRRGFCLVVGAEQGRLAYELARQSELKIYGIESDATKVSAARQALSSAGLYGHRVTVHQLSEDALPYPSYFANLIVSDRVLRTGELPVSAEFVARHLKPAGGVVCFGQPDREAAGSLAVDWLNGASLNGQSQIAHEGSWATLTRGTLPGAGNWSHQYAEPGNTASSGDKIVQGGLGVLWYGDPGPELMVNRHQGAVGPLVVDGRMIIQGEDSLMAYDVYNGLFLWKVENAEAVRTGVFQNRAPGNLAAGDDQLFHMVRDRVYVHDLATGEVKTTYVLPDSVNNETQEWGYIGYRDGRLIGTATTRETIARRFRRRGNPGAAATDAVFAIDTKTGKHLWVYQGKSIDFQTIALGPDRVFFIDSSVTSEQREDILRQDKTELKALTGEAARRAEERMKQLDVRLTVAIDAAEGDVLWKTPVDVTDCSDIGIGGGKLTMIYQDDTLLLCGANANGHYWKQFIAGEFERRRLVALSATVGYKLWAKDANYRHRPIIIGSRIIAEPWAFDLRTGEQETREHPLTGEEVPWSIARPGHHCGMITGSDNMLVFRSGFTGFYDLNSDTGTRHFAGHRLGCWINAIPTNGLVVMPEASAGCVCMFSIASTIVMEPREPRRPWSLFSQTGPSTPVRQLALNFGAPGDRRDPNGKLWLSWPRPSDKPRNKSTDKTGLALVFDLKTDFVDGGGFVSHDGDATVTDTSGMMWVASSGGHGLRQFSLPLLGTDDPPGTYTVRLHLGRADSAAASSPVDIRLQGETVAKSVVVKAASEEPVIHEFQGVAVKDRLVVELAPHSDMSNLDAWPVVLAIEVHRP